MTRCRYRLHLPEGFLQKDVNEPVVGEVLRRALEVRAVRRGDQRLREPDLLLDGVGEEVTFAAEGKHLSSFIGEYCDGVYDPDEARNAMTLPIFSALDRKLSKQYVNAPVRVAVLCMLELFDWTADVYGEALEQLPHRERDAFFSILKKLYLESGQFSEIHLLVPTLTRSWAVFEIGSGVQYLVPVGKDPALPYFEEIL
jgi:hypothetical protein